MGGKSHDGAGETCGAFGLRFASDLALPELRDATGAADARILLERTAEPPPKDEMWWSIDADATLMLSLDDLRYTVASGERIEIIAGDDVPDHEIRVWLLGRAMSALLLQRGFLLVHANAVAFGAGEAAAVLGESGDGKSTLAAALLAAGVEPLCDDLLAIRFDDAGDAWVAPGVPRIKLGPAAAKVLGIDISDAPEVGGGMNKRQLALDLERSWDRSFRLTRLYRLERGDLAIEPLKGREAAAALLDNLFWPELQAVMPGQEGRFVQAMRLADRCACFVFRRPFALDRLVQGRDALVAHLATDL
ncbi:hypothetical protein WJS89_08830 [Sphingomicrobium sp. XHP0235]|uniref:hypothetical protein n=1 Tax=Sphingomicrobium aquimarinum TaxID=3133971 RepID=UPI0031FEDF15